MINYKFISLPKIYKYLNGNEWLLFTVLFDEWQLMKNEEGYFFRSWNSLKEDTGLSNDGLNSALKGLIEKKFISKKTYEKKTQKSNDYRVEVDYIASLIPTPNKEKATPKIGEGYSEKQSTSKEERTKEKIDNISCCIPEGTSTSGPDATQHVNKETTEWVGNLLQRGYGLLSAFKSTTDRESAGEYVHELDKVIGEYQPQKDRVTERQWQAFMDFERNVDNAIEKKNIYLNGQDDELPF